MALPGPGPSLSMDQIGVEFGDSRPHALNEFYRGGPLVSNYPANNGVPTANQIAIGNFYGANNRNVINVTITGNVTNYDAYANRTPTYFPGKTDITFTINPGVFVSSPTTGIAAFSVPNAFSPGDTVRIVNNGTILGGGGNGGNGGPASPGGVTNGGNGNGGGTALSVSRPLVMTNNGNLWGGGGGGGGGGAARVNDSFFPGDGSYTFPSYTNGGCSGGGGGGGGRGGGSFGFGGSTNVPFNASGGSPGTSGSLNIGGNPGPGGSTTGAGGTATAGAGGGGGGAGSVGGGGGNPPSTNNFASGGGGGGAGAYVIGNPFVTYPATGSRLGNVG